MLALLAVVQGAALQQPEVWEPRFSWGCVVSSGKKPLVVNGVIAQRNQPDLANKHARFERALRIVRDDTGLFSGQQARWPAFVIHSRQYWAFFKGADGKTFGPEGRSIILNKDKAGRPLTIELYDRGGATAKPFARGDCISRVLSPEIAQ